MATSSGDAAARARRERIDALCRDRVNLSRHDAAWMLDELDSARTAAVRECADAVEAYAHLVGENRSRLQFDGHGDVEHRAEVLTVAFVALMKAAEDVRALLPVPGPDREAVP